MRDSAMVNYHIRSAETQAFHIDVDGETGNIVMPEFAPTRIHVQNLRDDAISVDFDTDGITFENHVSEVTDFEKSTDWKATYDDELRSLLEDWIGAKEVIVFDHTVRIDDPDAGRRPARHVHNDFSPASARKCLLDTVGEERASEFEAGHYGFVNVWRPVERPIYSSPLGFIRPNSVKADDWMTIELLYPNWNGQILGLAENQDHDWFYMPIMTPDEVVVFNTYDNQGRHFLGHSALDMEGTGAVSAPRKSIESRTLVRYR